MINEEESGYDSNLSNKDSASKDIVPDQEDECGAANTKLVNFYGKINDEIKSENVENPINIKITKLVDNKRVFCNGKSTGANKLKHSTCVDEEAYLEDEKNIFAIGNKPLAKPEKPRIILTLRPREHNPDSYLSKLSEIDNGSFKEGINLNNIISGEVDANFDNDYNNFENNSKKKSNKAETNSRSSKQKSFSSRKKSRKKTRRDKESKKIESEQVDSNLEPNSSNFDRSRFSEDSEKESPKFNGFSDYEGAEEVEMDLEETTVVENLIDLTSVSINKNEIVFNDSLQKSEFSKPRRRRKRYFRGISYSFNRRKTKKKKNQIVKNNSLHRNVKRNKFLIFDSKTEFENEKSELFSEPSESTFQSLSNKRIIKTDDLINSEIDDNFTKILDIDTLSLCLCHVEECIYIKSDGKPKLYCQAVDSVEGRHIGCCNNINNSGDIKLQRPSRRLPYAIYCDIHLHRLFLHQCCPICGLFCTQGRFKMCEKNHLYHTGCELLLSDQKKRCPHCGILTPNVEIMVAVGERKNPVFLEHQGDQKELPSARISFYGSLMKSGERAMSPFASLLLTLPSGKSVSVDGLESDSEKNKLEQYLLRLLSDCSTISPAVRHTYRTFHHAVKTGDVEKLLAHIACGLNPNHLFKDSVTSTALHAASAGGFLCTVHVLVQAGAQLDALDKDQNTPLLLAVTNKHNEIVKYLTKVGANVMYRDKDGMTALHLAAKEGNIEMCHYLLSNPNTPYEYVNFVDDGGWTALVWAAEHRHQDTVTYLLSKYADPMVRDAESNIALHWAAFAGCVEICEALLTYHSDVNVPNIHGDTPLHISARKDMYSCVVFLLARGSRTDIRNNAGFLPVECCITNADSDTHNAIKLNMQLNDLTRKCKERTQRILLNDITRGRELNAVQCVNGIDDDKAPDDFVYVTENCFTSHISIDRNLTSLQSCTCTDTCNTMNCLCAKLSLKCWYTDERKLSSDFNFLDPPMIFECNPLCKCNQLTCRNRVFQRGTTCRFELFRTKDRGWGLKTLKMIAKGSYVCEYVGEIISDIEADTREDDSYIFDLENRDGETYCIDACRYGNIARFINHSCSPNLIPVRTFVSHQDLHFPRITFFANRDIQPNEEIGYDYGEKFWIIKYKSFTCTCNVETCKYSKLTIQTTLETYNRKLEVEESTLIVR